MLALKGLGVWTKALVLLLLLLLRQTGDVLTAQNISRRCSSALHLC